MGRVGWLRGRGVCCDHRAKETSCSWPVALKTQRPLCGAGGSEYINVCFRESGSGREESLLEREGQGGGEGRGGEEEEGERESLVGNVVGRDSTVCA